MQACLNNVALQNDRLRFSVTRLWEHRHAGVLFGAIAGSGCGTRHDQIMCYGPERGAQTVIKSGVAHAWEPMS